MSTGLHTYVCVSYTRIHIQISTHIHTLNHEYSRGLFLSYILPQPKFPNDKKSVFLNKRLLNNLEIYFNLTKPDNCAK